MSNSTTKLNAANKKDTKRSSSYKKKDFVKFYTNLFIANNVEAVVFSLDEGSRHQTRLWSLNVISLAKACAAEDYKEYKGGGWGMPRVRMYSENRRRLGCTYIK